jgi:broad-specificity NMP kinase
VIALRTGPSGVGKTSVAHMLAEWNREFVNANSAICLFWELDCMRWKPR